MMNGLQWVKFSLALAPAINALVKDLFMLTQGSVIEAKKYITRIRDDWARLDEVRADTDSRLRAIDEKKP